MASKDLNAILKIQVDAMDLNTAPKLIIIWHLLSELLPPNKRLALSREIKISKTNYLDRKSTRLNSSHRNTSRMPSSA